MEENKNKILNVPTLRFGGFSDLWKKSTIEKNAKVYDGTHQTPIYTKSGVKFVSVENINDLYSSGKYISVDDYNSDFKYVPEINDILMTRIGDIGTPALVTKSEPLAYYVSLALLKEIDLEPHFLYHYIQTAPFQKELWRRTLHVAFPKKINKNEIGDCAIFYPSTRCEQKKIALFLDGIEKRIKIQNKIISDLNILKKELCNRYFKSVHNDTSLEYVTLKDILTERKEYCGKDGTYTHGTLSKEGVSPKTERYDRDFLVKNEDKQYKVTHFNDICYNPANLKFGVICRNTYGDLIFSPIYVTFEIADTVYPAYIELFLTNANFIGRIRRYEQGTVYERMAVSPEDFLSYETHMPTYEKQVKFADKIQRIQDKIELETLFLNYLQKQRKYLLNAMFI